MIFMTRMILNRVTSQGNCWFYLIFSSNRKTILDHAQDEITCFRISDTWRKHATPCFRYVKHAQKVVRFRCIRSNGNARKRHETGNGNTGYPSCFQNGLTCFCHVSVYGFLQFRPVPWLYLINPVFYCLTPKHWNWIISKLTEGVLNGANFQRFRFKNIAVK